jgi:hypothetical protein
MSDGLGGLGVRELGALLTALRQSAGRGNGPIAGAMTAALARSAIAASMRERVAAIASIESLTGALSGADFDTIQSIARVLPPAALVESGALEWLLGRNGRVRRGVDSGQIRKAYTNALISIFDVIEGDPDDPPPQRWSGAAVARLALAALEGADAARRANLAAALGRDLFGQDSTPNLDAAAAIIVGAGRRWIPADAAAELLPAFARTLVPRMIVAYTSAFGTPSKEVAAAGVAAAHAAAIARSAELTAAGRFKAASRAMRAAGAIVTMLGDGKPSAPELNSDFESDSESNAWKENSDAVPMEE